jgi:site-specific recombinase XerD
MDLVFGYINSNWHDSLNISLADLAHRTAFLLAARAILRSSDLARISSSSISFKSRSRVSFVIRQPKEATIREPHRLVTLSCTLPKASCAVCTLLDYYSRTRGWRDKVGDQDHLFVSYDRKFAPVTSQRIAKWLVHVLNEVGVDTTKFKAHSIRSASASHLLETGSTVDEVMRRAHWKSRAVFSKYYDRSTA